MAKAPFGQSECDREHERTGCVLGKQPLSAAHAEGHPPVSGGVPNRRGGQRDRVGHHGPKRHDQSYEQERIRDGRDDPDGNEAGERRRK
jgi:hypothetical protein